MKSISLTDITSIPSLEVGNTKLVGSTGIEYANKALKVPGYGWVPCSKKLDDNFTNLTKDLMLVILDTEKEREEIVTSDIWVTRSNIVGSLKQANNMRSLSDFLNEKNSDIDFISSVEKGVFAILLKDNTEILCDQVIIEDYNSRGSLRDISDYYVEDIYDSNDQIIPIIRLKKYVR